VEAFDRGANPVATVQAVAFHVIEFTVKIVRIKGLARLAAVFGLFPLPMT
jgi:hypothetical protein